MCTVLFGEHGVAKDSSARLFADEELISRYLDVYANHQESLKQLVDKCLELNKTELAEFTQRWMPDRDPSREYFFLLPDNRELEFPKLNDQTDRFWAGNLKKRNAKYAAELLSLAVRANEKKNDELAFRLLHECLFHDPTNQGAARVLSYVESEPRVKKNTYSRKEKLLPDGNVMKFESDHFVLFTTVDEKLARQAIQRFERWHIVWRQMFYNYWAQSSWLSRRFETEVKPIRRTKKFKVFLYKDRDEYIRKLKPISPGIEVSVGYYLFSEKTSFFYADKSSNDSTWIHELTHQFMHETIPVSSKSRIQSSIWAVEGIAIYMESYVDFGTYSTLGGEDAERLHFCRHNFFRRGFFVPIDDLNEMSQQEFVQNENVTGLYSLSGAYCHFVLRHHKLKKEFLKFLQLVHQGKNSNVFFGRLTSQLSFDQEFKKFLQPSKAEIENSLLQPARYKILYLGYSDVDDETLELLKDATRLETLDLSETRVTSAGIEKLKRLTGLQYLSLERTKVSDACFEQVGAFTDLAELDLTMTAVTDSGVSKMTGLQKLQILWVAGTRVSDRSVDSLLKLKSLQKMDIRKSGITEAGKKRLNGRVNLID